MADQADDSEKTEEATSKKLEDARKKGDMAKSQEVNTWFIMIATALVIGIVSTGASGEFARAFTVFLSDAHDISVDQNNLMFVYEQIGLTVLKILAIPMLLLMGAGIAGNLVQNMPVFSTENMKPKLSKISPKEGLKRLFSPKSLMNFAKGLVKLSLVSLATFLIVWPMRDQLLVLVTMDVGMLLPFVQSIAIKILAMVVAIMTVLAAADYVFEVAQWNKKQRMTVQEVKDEYKQMEGDPTVLRRLLVADTVGFWRWKAD